MSITLDGQILFDKQEFEIEPGSASRKSVVRAAPGLDGMLSIDMGGRDRKIVQKGVLRAKSGTQMNEKLIAISAYMDGDTHTLAADSGEEFDNLRMDVFKTSKERTSGGGVAVDYEIVYTQLVV
jgi:hypothetical protein